MAKTDSISAQIKDILDEYEGKVQDVANDAIGSVSKQSAQKLKDTSPKNTGSYAKGWSVKKQDSRGIKTAIVYNRTDYQLTHLLENGHIIRNKKGVYGRTNGIKHIAPVEEWAQDELPAEIERKL